MLRHPDQPSPAARWAAAGALASALVLGAAADLSAAAADCSRKHVSLDSVLTLSAAPSPDGHLLIVDLFTDRVVKLDLPSGVWRELPGIAGEALKSRRPEAVRAFGGGILVRQSSAGGVSGSFIELDEHLAVQSGAARRVTDVPGPDGRIVRSVALFEPADGRHIVTCSDLLSPAGDPGDPADWETGLVRIPLDAPAQFEVLHGFGYQSDTALACRLALPVVATLGERAYILTLGAGGAKIYEGRPGAKARELTAFPVRFANPPALPLNPTRDELPQVWGLVESSTRPVGLFAWEGALYLLSRSPAEQGGTDWWLTRIDPASDSLAGTVQLGTSANHLLVVPGERYWSLIEKGPVETTYWDQDVTGVVAVPADEIRNWQPDRLICGPPAAP